MKLTLLGTGDAGHIPVYGCDCKACLTAKEDPSFKRGKTSAVVEIGSKQLLIDGNAPDLLQRFPPGSLDAIWLTHYHMDHVQSLFDLRWGVGESILVYGPDDPNGCDDLFKHPGILAFQTPLRPFFPIEFEGISITPVPLAHSKVSLGYVFETTRGGVVKRLAYLTDTRGLPEETLHWLIENPVDLILIDCAFPPGDNWRNHNDVVLAKSLFNKIQPDAMGLIHIGHKLACWAMDNPDYFNDHFFLARDGQEFLL